MKIIEKHKDTLLSGTEVWLVQPDNIDDILRVCITPNRTPPEGHRAGLIIGTDAELSAGTLISTLKSCAVGLDLPYVYGVSIGYPLDANPPFVIKRNRDLTTKWFAFEPVTAAMAGLPGVAPTGGADGFLEFLAEELKPSLAEAFPIDLAEATLAGQSFGGLFTLYALLTRPEVFRRYLAVSPSLWWDDRSLLEAATRIVSEHPAPTASVYLCAGELENKARFGRQFNGPMPEHIKSVVSKALGSVDMPGDMFMMEQILSGWSGDQFSVEAHVYPEESHESIMGAALSRGLRRLHGKL
ncbi:alpha/beta hydrolase-fold protein [Mitsuaria sp. CC2]|uniref:alpha/beta hydrolase n=1 Tax=Mitsuaria sp. CC2 TaxID=3029186 RepID=UPI003B8BCB03